ncbi:hypothetical protein [Aeromicrobium sp. 9AM]|uniref:hypothetical protein n=1 Tax=Aeromicrobium sp. 9AM TaxID=2653126 RepID=UPI0012F1E7D0|nr:hypothetical protein [Aeromicrobium sp. 9AM]VXC07482.1 hypothetical protein AERO9AM_30610 [Aeromicrobium sp. 9AM]
MTRRNVTILTDTDTTSRPVTVISHTGRVLKRHVHDTGITCGGMPVVAVDGVLYVVGLMRSGHCIDNLCHHCTWPRCEHHCHHTHAAETVAQETTT